MPNIGDLSLPDDLFDRYTLGGALSPGVVTLSGHDRGQKIDVKEGDGDGGATTTHKGEQIVRFKASHALWKDARRDAFAEWEAFEPILAASLETKPPTAFDIYHPDLARPSIDVKSVTVEKVSGMVYDGNGGATVVVDYCENRPPKPKGGTPSGSSANGGKPGGEGAAGPETDPNADAQRELDEQIAEAREP